MLPTVTDCICYLAPWLKVPATALSIGPCSRRNGSWAEYSFCKTLAFIWVINKSLLDICKNETNQKLINGRVSNHGSKHLYLNFCVEEEGKKHNFMFLLQNTLFSIQNGEITSVYRLHFKDWLRPLLHGSVKLTNSHPKGVRQNAWYLLHMSVKSCV